MKSVINKDHLNVRARSNTEIQTHNAAEATAVIIAVPLYKAPELLDRLFKSLIDMAIEIADIGGQLVLINDSPDHLGLQAALAAGLPALERAVATTVLTNGTNIGFVKSANRALQLALDCGADVILLNSDAIPTAGAFTEMKSVAHTDPMISVVSPRSDNATICDSPYPRAFRNLGAAAALRAHQALAQRLPRITYLPTAVGFCLYIRNLMLREFGIFDEIYEAGYNEENDFILRCNLRGYRAVMANKAFVHHIGTVSFSQSDQSSTARERATREILLDRYPHYDAAVKRYFGGTEYKTQWLLAGLIPDAKGRLRVLIDGRHVGLFHNGTFEHTFGLVKALARGGGSSYSVHIACKPDVAAFHGFDRIPSLSICDLEDPDVGPFAVAFRIGQPFKREQVAALCELAPVTGFLFLDTISLDCLNLDDEGFDGVWRWMTQGVSLLGFNSNFTSDQFKRRFGELQDVVEFVSLCSTDVRDYSPPLQPRGDNGGILVVGNHYAHKHVSATVAELRKRTQRPITVLGAGDETAHWPDVIAHRAGELDQAHIDALYEEASLIVFPSHYEGFGLPLMHALARRKPAIARDLPASREIKARCPEGANLHLYATTVEIADAAIEPAGWAPSSRSVAPYSWIDAAASLREAMGKAIARCDHAGVHTRLVRMRMSSGSDREASERQADISAAYAERIDREAEMAALRAAHFVGASGLLRGLQVGARKMFGATSESAAVSWTLLREIRRCGLLDEAWYEAQYPDVIEQGWRPAAHYLARGFAEGRFPNPMFDTRWYLDVYADVRLAGTNPLLHYARVGEFEGRRPNAVFDPAGYASRYPEAAACSKGALFHYLRHGASQGLEASVEFDPMLYMAANKDLAGLVDDPLLHYVRWGRAEGRPTGARKTIEPVRRKAEAGLDRPSIPTELSVLGQHVSGGGAL